MAQKKGFTLIEMLIVLVVIGMLLVMTVSRLHGQRERVDMLLGTQQREDIWSRTVQRMREGRRFDQVQITLTATGVTATYSGGLLTGGSESLLFTVPFSLLVTSGNLVSSGATWHMTSYAVGCQGPGSGNRIEFQRGEIRACYQVDTDLCALQKRTCPTQ